ncbi:MAG: aspartoacylase [Scytolyngbya sp. HA4215-MV1]|jgi:aspartoacylase|nr:aspartoacylase [Scytolyngbya sp. HA4215-MV1]
MNPITRVAVVGGTHGNELTGIYLVKKFEQLPHLIRRSSFESIALLANPKAYELRRRYVDLDLNRCFRPQDLENPHLTSYEALQAKKIYQDLTANQTEQIGLLMDLHSTTANMGMTLILNHQHPFNLHLAAHLAAVYPEVKFYRWAQAEQDSPFLRSIYPLGCAIEVGPVAQGLLDAHLFRQTEALIHTILDYVEAYNRGQLFPTKETLTVYQCVQTIDYPRDGLGTMQAMIHPNLQSRDYEPLYPGDPMFLTFEGETIVYEGESILYPVFINEAAYYEKGIAMCLTHKELVTL